MTENTDYKNIFKSTFLFGFIQVFNILVKVGINKAVAILLGPGGMGAIGLFQNATNFLSSVAGLGINQSSVRDLSEARGYDDRKKIGTTISSVKRIIRYTSIGGIMLTIALSPVLSRLTFGNNDYIWPYIALSLMTGALVQTAGYRALNTGMRQLRFLALSNLWGSAAGLVVALPFYYMMGKNGIIPSLIVSSFATLLISKYYADKITYQKVSLTLKETLVKSSQMIKMGISLMLMSFMLSLSSLVLTGYISNHGGIDKVGIYQAGATVMLSYFAVIISAMSTEYYPRICAFCNDNAKLKEAVNTQSETGLIIAMPLVVIFVFALPYILRFLYSAEFLEASEYIDYAIIGSITIICSTCIGTVLLAKQDSKTYLLSSLLSITAILAITILLYNLYGLRGLGIGYALNGIVQIIMYQLIMKLKFDISFNRRVTICIALSVLCCFLARVFRNMENETAKWLCEGVLFLLTTTFTIIYMKNKMGIDFIKSIKARLKK